MSPCVVYINKIGSTLPYPMLPYPTPHHPNPIQIMGCAQFSTSEKFLLWFQLSSMIMILSRTFFFHKLTISTNHFLVSSISPFFNK